MNPRVLLYVIGCAALALPGCSSQANLSSLPVRDGAGLASAGRAGDLRPASGGPAAGDAPIEYADFAVWQRQFEEGRTEIRIAPFGSLAFLAACARQKLH